MTTLEFVSHLRALGVQLWAEDNRLRVNAPEGVLTPELRAELARRKTELVAFLRQLASVAADPDRRLSELPRLTPTGRNLVGPTNAFVPFAKEEIEQSLAARFEKQAERRPDRVAVEADGETLSYDALNRAAMNLSRVVGFIAQPHDELLTIENAADPEEALRSVTEQLSRIPNNGTSWQWVNVHQRTLVDAFFIPYDTLWFNYLGYQTARPDFLRSFPLPPSKAMEKERIERGRFECQVSVTDNQFTLEWRYFPAYHKPATVERLAQEYLDTLRLFISATNHSFRAATTP
jgi:hypothetical protein